MKKLLIFVDCILLIFILLMGAHITVQSNRVTPEGAAHGAIILHPTFQTWWKVTAAFLMQSDMWIVPARGAILVPDKPSIDSDKTVPQGIFPK